MKPVTQADPSPALPLVYDENSTKWKIFVQAVKLFAAQGIDAVSMRTIANAAGIRVSSFYNHFSSKEQLIQEIFSFYEMHLEYIINKPDVLLDLVDTAAPKDVLRKLTVHYMPQYEAIMSLIFKIIIDRARVEPLVYELICNTYYTQIERTMRPVLEKMLAREKIKPIDIHTFILIFRNMALSASQYINTPLEISKVQWREMTDMLYDFILVE